MIPTLPLLWRQLDGPQSNSIIDAIFQWFKDLCDPIMDYFNRWDIVHCNEKHLDIMGTLMGCPRPVVFNAGDHDLDKWFRVHEGYYKSNTGVGDPYTDDDPPLPTTGGLLDYEGHTIAEAGYMRLNTDIYRKILLTIVNSDAEVGSFKLLDELVYVILGQRDYRYDEHEALYPGDVPLSMKETRFDHYATLQGILRLWEPDCHVEIAIGDI